MNDRTKQPAGHDWHRLAAATAGLLIAFGAGGCAKSLFPRGEVRSQFDRYDLARNTHQPTYIENEFGRREPNLKGRLTPR